MPRGSSLISASILLGAALVGAALMTSRADATRTTGAEHGAVGYIDVYALIDIIVLSDEDADERLAFQEDSESRLGAIESQLGAMSQQLQTMDPQNPETQQMYGQYQQLSQLYQQTSATVSGEYQALVSEQISAAYKRIHESINEIHDELGYAFVLATRRGLDMSQDTTAGITQEILARPLMTTPGGVDLTDALRVHMGLPTIEEVRERQAEREAARAAEIETLPAGGAAPLAEPAGASDEADSED